MSGMSIDGLIAQLNMASVNYPNLIHVNIQCPAGYNALSSLECIGVRTSNGGTVAAYSVHEGRDANFLWLNPLQKSDDGELAQAVKAFMALSEKAGEVLYAAVSDDGFESVMAGLVNLAKAKEFIWRFAGNSAVPHFGGKFEPSMNCTIAISIISQIVRPDGQYDPFDESYGTISVVRFPFDVLAKAIRTRENPATEAALIDVIPSWDQDSRILRFGAASFPFTSNAKNVIAVLDKFESEGWPSAVSSPLEPSGGIDPYEQLKKTAKTLNRLKILRFSAKKQIAPHAPLVISWSVVIRSA